MLHWTLVCAWCVCTCLEVCLSAVNFPRPASAHQGKLPGRLMLQPAERGWVTEQVAAGQRHAAARSGSDCRQHRTLAEKTVPSGD